MKTRALIFSLIVIALSGCATPGYQRTYVGYGSAYGSGGYSAPSYYRYPSSSYYQPGAVIRYQQFYGAPSAYPRDHHADEHHHDRPNWDRPNTRYRNERWQPRDVPKSWHEHGGRAAPSWAAEAKKRQSSLGDRRFHAADQSVNEGRRSEGGRAWRQRSEQGGDFQERSRGREGDHGRHSHHRD